MSKQTPAKLTPEQYAARFNAEKAALQRHARMESSQHIGKIVLTL